MNPEWSFKSFRVSCFSSTVWFVLATCILVAADAAAIGSRPNIILYFADDMGWGDLGCYGQEKIATPHLDRMAAQGIRFTDAYTGSPVCASARSSLMEGLHSGHMLVRNNRSLSNELVHFGDDQFTLAELLKQAGYATGIFGKWGLAGPGTDGVPTRKGFDEFHGFLDQRKAHHYYPDTLWHNDREVDVPLSEEKGYSSADYYFGKSVNFIRRNAGESDKPFFAYIATQLPHLYMPYAPDEAYKDKPWPEGEKRWATMIHRIDQQVGQILDLVEELGIAENTLILFSSDNGGGSGQRVYYHDVRFFDSNAHFRGTKRDLYEGGIRVPFLASWKGTIAPGGVSSEPVVHYDLMATFAELAREEIPVTDGLSWLPILVGTSETLNREYLYWEFPYMDSPYSKFAVRMGKWKAVTEWDNQPLQVYNLEEDPEEKFNWRVERPDLVEKFGEIIQRSHEPSPHWPLRQDEAVERN